MKVCEININKLLLLISSQIRFCVVIVPVNLHTFIVSRCFWAEFSRLGSC